MNDPAFERSPASCDEIERSPVECAPNLLHFCCAGGGGEARGRKKEAGRREEGTPGDAQLEKEMEDGGRNCATVRVGRLDAAEQQAQDE